MANAMWPKPMGCFRLITSLSGSVPIMGVHMSHIYLFPKRFRNLALAQEERGIRFGISEVSFV
ncbi:hypothetical protein Krac_3575 [Ktedonobacter racemifer DSM 44963]|uniref:Uncharacterized protein n=1 Tax=Ktedonobacter racemifer DSM 44963 TaxID=485913 RepID=D6U264_KTERA|nr:hypothetical protein Krac_3575 [Ktedonobacter racemifer DSM 44963]